MKNKTVKLALVILLPFIISYILTNIIVTKTKLSWNYVLNYEHIERKFDVNYETIKHITGTHFQNQFSIFIDKLDDRVNSYSSNICKNLKNKKGVPGVIFSESSGFVELLINGRDKKLIEKCIDYIETEFQLYEVKFKEILLNLLKNAKYIDKAASLSTTQEATSSKDKKEKLIDQLKIKFFGDEINVEELTAKYNLEQLINFLVLSEFFFKNEDAFSRITIDSKKIKDLNIITKIYSNSKQNQPDTNLLYLSFYLGFQVIFLFIFYIDKSKGKKKRFKQFFEGIFDN